MRTKRHAEKLAERRAAYGDKRVSRQLDRDAARIRGETGMPLAEARHAALQAMIREIAKSAK